MSRSTSPGTWRTRAGSVAALAIATSAVALFAAPGSGSISGAADPTITPIVVDDTVDTAPLVSDDGSIVVFTSSTPVDPPADAAAPDPGTDPVPELRVRLHDRSTGETIELPDAEARFAALSGDGCTIAYAVPAASSPLAPSDGPVDPDTPADPVDPVDPNAPAGSVEPGESAEVVVDELADEPALPQQFDVRIVDRCDDAGTLIADPASSLVATTGVVAPLALDRDGLTLAVNTGDHVTRFTRSPAADDAPATPFAETDRFDRLPVADDASVTLGPVDVSADGAVVVYEAGPTPPAEPPAPDAPAPEPSGIHVWEAGVVTSLVPDATSPSISGDGRLVAVVSRDPAAPTGAGVQVVDRGPELDTASILPIEPLGEQPTMSSDGSHVLFLVTEGDTAGLRRASWSGDAAEPFTTLEFADLAIPLEGDVRLAVPTTPAAITPLGTVIVSDDPLSGDLLVRTVPATAAFDADEYDLGSGDVGTTLAGQASLRNTGGSTIDLDAAVLAVGSPFVLVEPVDGAACTGRLRPGGTCSVTIEYAVDAPIDTVADLTLNVPGEELPIATAQVAAIGTAPTTTSTTTPTTAVPTVTTPNTTPNTVPPRTPLPVPPRTPVRPTTTTTTTTTIPPVPTFSPTTFEFAPTIVDAGRRVASLAIANSATTSVQVVEVAVESGDAAFAIAEGSDCAGSSIASGATCRVDVAFAPTVEGPATATLVATFADGREARASVSGLGAPPPVVDIVPGVASIGQVVTIRGSGYPAGAMTEVQVGSEHAARSVTVGDTGLFDLPIVVMPNTTPGPLVISVLGQPDLFPTVESTLLVTVTGDRTSPSILRGLGPNVGR